MASPKLQMALAAKLGKHEANELLALIEGGEVSLTPWTENIDAAGNSLLDVAAVQGPTNTFAITSTTFGLFAKPATTQQANIPAPSGGGTVDAQSRTAIEQILAVLNVFGFMADEA